MFRQKNTEIILILFILGLFLAPINFSSAKEVSPKYPDLCAVYLTGIGCSNCATTDPLIFSKLLAEYDDLVVIEYEIYKSASANKKIAMEYFDNYLSNTRSGVPFFLLNKDSKALGSREINKIDKTLRTKDVNFCSLPSGQSESFSELDLNSLPGAVKIWHKDRVLISGKKNGNNNRLKKLLISSDLKSNLEELDSKKIKPRDILISKGKIFFKNAVKIGGWIFQWEQEKVSRDKPKPNQTEKKFLTDYILSLQKTIKTKNLYISLEALVILLLFLLLFWKKIKLLFSKKSKALKNLGIIIISLVTFAFIFIIAKNIPTDFLKEFGANLPLPFFTFIIALVDGFNPCNLFVLTLLLALLVSASGNKKKIYAVGFVFVFIIFLFYFLFMVAWLNIFKYFGFFTPLRLIIGVIAIIAGLINCKDFFFFKKGVSLTIGQKQKEVLVKKMNRLRKIAEEGSVFVLILSSIGLAVFSSFVELPCTAGFPIIFTTVLAGKIAIESSSYYLWILFYNLIYVLPLVVIVAIFGYTFQAKRISQRQIKIIKLIGGVIMVVLGLILIINPQIVGVALQ
ncbi:MAG: hypothetical protein K9L84_01135 [Candidatus Omnitrophica bacterium]|nr:hypothetical protein [Candidatus Omnitrophota bacterium]MCF7893655.1 hypothetical protein [Candidatus Omnitrophota bacterium]